MNDGNNENFARDLIAFMVMCGVIGGPILLVAWFLGQILLGVMF